MAGDDNWQWLMRESAAATIIYNHPVWSKQEYAMQRGEWLRGDFDSPVPAHLVDALRARWSEASALCNRMATEGCDTLPVNAHPDTWVAVDGDMLIAGRYARDHGIRWVPRALADYHPPARLGRHDARVMANVDIETIRAQIRAMDFVRGRPAEIGMWQEDMADSRANLVIENIIPTPNDDAFFATMLDEGMPPLLVSQILLRLLDHPNADRSLPVTPMEAY